MAARKLRIFISSPGDVGQERLIATRVVERLQGEFAGYFELEPILWEHEPLRASAHFQDQITPPSETDIVVVILWSRLGTRLPENFKREDGSFYSSGTEWEFEDALRAFRERGAPDLMVYRKTAEPHASISNEEALLQRLGQKKALEAFIDRWFGNPKDAFRAAFHAFDAPEKFEELLENHLRRLIQERLPKHATDEGGAHIPITWHKGSPFRGLEVFDFDHAPVFFGRTSAISGIKEALARQASSGCAFVLVLGMSGSGKSSLVRAGVVPTITRPGVIEGIGLWRWCIFRPSDAAGDLFDGLALALAGPQALPELETSGLPARVLATLLREAPQHALTPLEMGIKRAAEAVAAQEQLSAPPETRLLIVLDQVEELFTRAQIEPAQRERFFAVISILARSGLVWVIGTMRSDFYPRCAEIPDLVALKKGAGQFDVLPPTFAEIGQIIRFPARAAGLRFEVNPQTGERLDDVLHATAGKSPEALPLLEFTLDELFSDRSEEGVLTFAAYNKLGGLEGALARRAEEVFTSMPPEVQATLPSVLRGLVTLGEGNVIASRRVPLASVAVTPEHRALVDAFIATRLLVSDRANDGEPVVRVAHEALLHHWPRLQEWLEEDREFLRVRDRVAGDAARWREEKKRADFLLREGKPLSEAAEMLAERRSDLGNEVAEYVEASQRHVAGAHRRKVGLVSGVLASFFAVVSGFGVFSYRQWKNAEKQTDLAMTAIGHLTYDLPNQLKGVPGTLPILRTVLEQNDDLLKQVGGKKARREQSVSLTEQGDTWFLLGDTRKALDAYKESLAMRETLARDTPGPLAQRDLSVSYERIGDVLRSQGDVAGALAAYEKSLSIRTALAKGSAPKEARRDLSVSYQKVGDVHKDQGDTQGAQESYGKSLAIDEELAKDKADAQAQRDLSIDYAKNGDIRLALRDPQGALEAYEKSLAIGQELARNNKDARTQRDLSINYLNIGGLQALMGNTVAAQEAYSKALAIREVLARADKDNAQYQRDLAQAYGKVAYFELFSRPKEAIADATKGLKIEPDQVLTRMTLAHAYLLDNQPEKAKVIYLENRAVKINPNLSFAQAVLADFQDFKQRGLTRPGMAEIEKLLSGTT